MTKKLIAMALSSMGLAAAGAYADEGHLHQQRSADPSSTTSLGGESLGRQTQQQSAQGPETVKKVQAALVMEGYNPGQVDGEFTRETEEALKQAQKDKSLEPTGQLDHQTLAALGVTESESDSTPGAENGGRQ